MPNKKQNIRAKFPVPSDLLLVIGSYLDHINLLQMLYVSSDFNRIFSSDKLWQACLEKIFPDYLPSKQDTDAKEENSYAQRFTEACQRTPNQYPKLNPTIVGAMITGTYLSLIERKPELSVALAQLDLCTVLYGTHRGLKISNRNQTAYYPINLFLKYQSILNYFYEKIRTKEVTPPYPLKDGDYLNRLLLTIILNQPKVLSELLPLGLISINRTDYDRTMLAMAATCGHAQVVSVLLKNGAHPDGAVPSRPIEDAFSDLLPLPIAAKRGYPEIVELLLAHDASPDGILGHYENKTPLQEAIMRLHIAKTDQEIADYKKIINLLLPQFGANPNIPANANNNSTAISLVLNSNNDDPEVLTLLLAAKADTNLACPVFKKGKMIGHQPPLVLAALSNRPAHVEALLNAGADPNIAHSQDLTALHAAAGRRAATREVAELLVKHGANPIAVTNKGDTPLSLARKYNASAELIAFLETAEVEWQAKLHHPKQSPKMVFPNFLDFLSSEKNVAAAERAAIAAKKSLGIERTNTCPSPMSIEQIMQKLEKGKEEEKEDCQNKGPITGAATTTGLSFRMFPPSPSSSRSSSSSSSSSSVSSNASPKPSG